MGESFFLHCKSESGAVPRMESFTRRQQWSIAIVSFTDSSDPSPSCPSSRAVCQPLSHGRLNWTCASVSAGPIAFQPFPRSDCPPVLPVQWLILAVSGWWLALLGSGSMAAHWLTSARARPSIVPRCGAGPKRRPRSACIIACSIPAATRIPSPTTLLQKTLLQALLWWMSL